MPARRSPAQVYRCLLALAVVVVMLPTYASSQTTQPTSRTGTMHLDGTDYRFTLTPMAVPPVGQPAPTPVTPVKPIVPPKPPATPAPPAPATQAASFVVIKPFAPVAPATVHVNALGIPLKAGTCLTARYEWDFGDGSPTARLVGWTAAHTYDVPGEYDLSLRLTDEAGVVSTVATKVVVHPDSRFAFHVAADGDDSNPGTPDRPVRTFTRAATMVRNDTRILFRRGDRFDVVKPMTVKHRGVLVGAYGDETKPLPVLWRLTGEARTVVTMFHPTSDVTIQDLCFDSPFLPDPVTTFAPKIAADAVYAAGRNVTVRRCVFLNVGDCVNTERKVDGLLVEGNRAPLATGVRSYLVWGVGTDHVYLNNAMANSTREHGFRMVDLSRVLIAGNTMANLDRTRAGDKEDIAKGCIEVHRGSYAYVTGNHVTEGALRVGPRGGTTDTPDAATDWCVIEGNTLDDVGIQVRPGAHHLMIRNNLVRGVEGVKLFAADAQRVATDVVIDRNTTIAPGEMARFLLVEGRAERVTLTNNLLVAPKMKVGFGTSSAVYVGASDLACFTTVAGNVWPVPAARVESAGDGLFYVAAQWGVPNGYVSPQRWNAFAQVRGDTFANVTPDAAGRATTLPAGLKSVGAVLPDVRVSP